MPRLFNQLADRLDKTNLLQATGRVVDVTGLTIVAEGLFLPVGSMCVVSRSLAPDMHAQLIAVRHEKAILMTLEEPLGVSVGDPVRSAAGWEHVAVGRQMLGVVLDGRGVPIGGQVNFIPEARYPIFRDAPPALSRGAISDVLPTGIRSIDAMHTLGAGQRLGIFAGTGVGKSILLGMIARYTGADVVVVALVGERGREVGEFIRKDLGEEGMKRCVMVVSTSDESPVLRVRAAFVATAVAEYFRDLGQHVLLLMDSTTRIAMAQRQIGLSAGEPPTTKGYPPSVFSLLPRLLERAGCSHAGSITGMYSVLVEGDDINEPIADAIRGTLDGHIWLSRTLANRAHYPAISVLDSISRVMPDVVDQSHIDAATTVRKVLGVWQDIEDLVNVGAYAPGANLEFDVAVKIKPIIDTFLQQSMTDCAPFATTTNRLTELADAIEQARVAFAQSPTAMVRKAS